MLEKHHIPCMLNVVKIKFKFTKMFNKICLLSIILLSLHFSFLLAQFLSLPHLKYGIIAVKIPYSIIFILYKDYSSLEPFMNETSLRIHHLVQFLLFTFQFCAVLCRNTMDPIATESIELWVNYATIQNTNILLKWGLINSLNNI